MDIVIVPSPFQSQFDPFAGLAIRAQGMHETTTLGQDEPQIVMTMPRNDLRQFIRRDLDRQ